MPSLILADLSEDVCVAIFEFCDTSALQSLCSTSTWCGNIARPLLYRQVDLSTHNRGLLTYDRSINHNLWADGVIQPYPDEGKDKMVRRQRRFLETLLDHPQYGAYVRDFTWTLLFGPLPPYFGPGNLPQWIIDSSEYEKARPPLVYPDTETWRVLECLENVRTLDLGSCHYSMRHAYVHCVPRRLFPRACSVRLVGWMNRELPHAILQSLDPGQLRCLCIDDVQHWGKDQRDGQPLDWLRDVDDEEYWEGYFTGGPLGGLLTPLLGHCCGLDKLYLRKVSEYVRAHYDDDFWDVAADEKIYEEWAEFIQSVKGTVRYLCIEQAYGEVDVPRPRRARRLMRYREPFPKDLRFGKYILPVLLSGGWAHLRRLEIRGVSTSHVLDDNMTAKLQTAIGDSAVLLVRRACSRPAVDWYYNMSDYMY